MWRFIPEALKSAYRNSIHRIAGRMFLPSHGGDNSYTIPGDIPCRKGIAASAMPVPPPEMWLGYGKDEEEYLASGARDVATMQTILQQDEFDLQPEHRVLEFGCCTGRMIRHLIDDQPYPELWGVDFHGEYIQWCRQNLSPKVHVALTTSHPHLPFPDQMFDLIFCGSVFTHIEDLDSTWLLELARILKPGGRLYFTIHDDHTVSLVDGDLRESAFGRQMWADSEFATNHRNFSQIVVGRKDLTQVFHHPEYLRVSLPPMLEWRSLTHEAYGIQSGVLLRKVDARSV